MLEEISKFEMQLLIGDRSERLIYISRFCQLA